MNNKIIIVPDVIKPYLVKYHFRLGTRYLTVNDLVKLVSGEQEIYQQLYLQYPHNYAISLNNIVPKIVVNNDTNDQLVSLLSSLYNEKWHIDFTNQDIKVLNVCDQYLKNLNITDNINVNCQEKILNVYNDIDSEVQACFNQISSLLKQGVDIDEISIAYASEEYQSTIEFFSMVYNINIVNDDVAVVYNHKDFLQFIDKAKASSIKEALKEYQESVIIDPIINILNQVYNFDEELQVKYLINQAKNTPMTFIDTVNCLKVMPYSSLKVNKYTFILGCDKSHFPKPVSQLVLTDQQAELLAVNTSVDLNTNQQLLVDLLTNIDNIYFSQAKKIGAKEMLINPLFIANEEDNNTFSKQYLELNSAYNKQPYQGIDQAQPFSHHDVRIDYKKHIELSYSSIDEYFDCPYRYYLSRVVKLKENSNNKNARGNIFHKVMELAVKQRQFDIDSLAKFALEAINKEQDKLSTLEVKTITQWLQHEFKDMQLFLDSININDVEELKVEEELIYPIAEQVSLKGYIDLLIKEDNYYSVIDYKVKKTSSASIKIEDINSGKNMQNAIYLYLLNEIYSDFNFKASVQMIYPPHPITNNVKDKPSFSCIGYVNDVNGIDTKKHKQLKELDQQQLDDLLTIVVNHIKDAIEAISAGRFNIMPRKEGCNFCPYHSICQHNKKTFRKDNSD